MQLPPEIQRVNIYPDIPDDTLMCGSEPLVPPTVVTDRDLAEWAQRVRDAGDDCRRKLDAVRGIRESWPKM